MEADLRIEGFGKFEEEGVEECLEMKEAQEMSPRPLKEKQEVEKGDDRRRLANSDSVAFEELYKVSIAVVVVVVDVVVDVRLRMEIWKF